MLRVVIYVVEIEIEIYSDRRSSGVLYWKGLFSISDTEDNFQNTVAVLNPFRINDDYRTILEKADMQYELDSLTLILEQVRVGYSEKFNLDTVWTNGSIGTAFSTFNASGGTITQASAGAGVGYEAYVGLGTGVAADDIVILDVSAFTSNTTPTFDIMQGAGSSITDEGAKQITVGLMGFTMSGLSSTPRVWLQAPPGDTTNTSFTARVIRTANDKTQAGEL